MRTQNLKNALAALSEVKKLIHFSKSHEKSFGEVETIRGLVEAEENLIDVAEREIHRMEGLIENEN